MKEHQGRFLSLSFLQLSAMTLHMCLQLEEEQGIEKQGIGTKLSLSVPSLHCQRSRGHLIYLPTDLYVPWMFTYQPWVACEQQNCLLQIIITQIHLEESGLSNPLYVVLPAYTRYFPLCFSMVIHLA